MEILCFFAGIAFVYTKSIYPLGIMVIGLVLQPRYLAIVAFFLAVFWGGAHYWWSKDSGMPLGLVLNNAKLHGTIISLPANNANKAQFEFAADQINTKKINAIILISCYQQCEVYKTGQTWTLEVKLKRPQNLANPGYFDLVAGLAARHIYWTGYIKRPIHLHSNKEWSQTLLIVRDKFASVLAQFIPETPILGIVQALTLGITTNISKEQWELFRRTGTTHLMVISGSHIGLIVGFCYWIMKWLWSRSSRFCLYYPATKIATIVGVLTGIVYALLAGFAPPCQRSLLACFFLLLRNFLSYRFTVWQAWRYGLLAVIVYEPHAILLPGFYLSFIAVAILILINQRITGGNIKKAMVIQLACLAGLMPLSLYWFSYGAISGLLANALAIPWVGFIIVPLSLLSILLLQWFDMHFLAYIVKKSIEWLLLFLHWVDTLSTFNLEFSFTQLLSPLALMLAMLIVVFLPIKAIFPAVLVLFLSSFFPAYQNVKTGAAKIDFLDVGQGLAVVVTTANHRLIYDTGMKFYQGSDMGKLAIIPYLNTLGIDKIDKVIISHSDLDHRGGLASLEAKYPIAELIVDQVSFYQRGKDCHHYHSWQWDGVSFQFLAITKKFPNKNNHSCVLQIANKSGKVLLAGDIEKPAEDYLVAKYKEQLRADILLIPHHGSKTSSSSSFIKLVAPHYGIISAGFDNRYHFPHPATLKTLEKQNVVVYNTANCGMVSVKLNEKMNKSLPTCYKK